MKIFLLLLTLAFALSSKAQNLYFPPISGTNWDTIDPISLGYCQENIDILHDYLNTTNSKAFIMLKDGKIVFEWYYDDFTKDSLHIWNSAGKTLTAMAVGIAQQEGYLSLNDTTSHYLGQGWTSLTPQQEEKITIWNQLTMTTGLNHTGDHFCTDPSCLVYIAEPGTRWMYHNAPYTLLDGVIESATGMNLNAYVNQKIRSKIGMNGFFFPAGYNNINLSNARSMARYGLLLLGQGTWNGTAVLNDPTFFQEMTNSSQTLNPAYGYLTWLNGKGSFMLPSPDVQLTINEDPLPNAPLDLFAALGKDGQIINIVPSQNVVFIRMGDSDGTSLVGTQYNDTIWQNINQLTCNATIQDFENQKITLSPNPSHNYLHISAENEVVKTEIFNPSGEKIKQMDGNKTISIEDLESGFYILKVYFKDSTINLRFIKQ
ncbi:MAG: serine hydrolase [Flavobacteriia bacterium]